MRDRPKKFLFDIDTRSYQNATINWRDKPLDEFEIYAGAYHRAAEKLMDNLLEQPGFHDIDPCPIIFLYRHSIELYLKAICLIGIDLFKVLNKRLLLNGNDIEQEKLFMNHKLLPLIEVVQQIVEETNGSWDLEDRFAYFKEYDDFKAALGEIDAIDLYSFTFRYPYDKKEKVASLPKAFSFNLPLFKEKINIIITTLDGMSTQLKLELERALESVCPQQEEFD